MRVLIEIECDTIANLITHLRVLDDQIMNEADKRKMKYIDDIFPVGLEISDDNCYGDHTLRVVDELP